MKKIGIVPNLLKDEELKMTIQAVNCLASDGFEIYLPTKIHNLIEGVIQNLTISLEEEELFKVCEAVIAIGGDGTILNVAQQAYKTQTPIIGVNLGRLGFLAHIESDDIKSLSHNLKRDDYTIEERAMLEVKLTRGNGETEQFYALNDMCIIKSKPSRIAEFEVKVNEGFVDFYAADGIIISTPTGSTAYNLSAGGPIVSPSANVMILTPICPHTIHARAIVISDHDIASIKTYNHNTTQLELAIDGQTKSSITPECSVEVRKAIYTTKLIKLQTQAFFDILRKKIVERH